MSKKLGLRIGGRRFDVDVEKDFAKFLESQMFIDFDIDGNNDAKAVLHGYVKKAHELYLLNKKIDKLLDKTEV